jgi:hypothetical protein
MGEVVLLSYRLADLPKEPQAGEPAIPAFEG